MSNKKTDNVWKIMEDNIEKNNKVNSEVNSGKQLDEHTQMKTEKCKSRIPLKMQGIIYIIMAGFFFSLMTFFVKLAGEVPTMQKVFFRNLIAAFFSIGILAKSKEGFKIKRTSYFGIAMRCICGTSGVICNFYAIDHLALADSNILNKLAPFFAIIASFFILKEKPNKVEWGTVILAFCGAIFVVKPSLSITSVYGLIAVLSGLGAGMAYTFVRLLGKQGERGPVIVMCFSLFSCIVSLPFVIFNYSHMTLNQLAFLLLAGFAATGGQLSITTAYTKAAAKEISVFDYSQIVFAAVLGFVFLQEIPDIYSFIGYTIIIGVAVFKWWYSLQVERQEKL